MIEIRVIKKIITEVLITDVVIEMRVIKKIITEVLITGVVIEMRVIKKIDHRGFDHNTIVNNQKKMSAGCLRLRFQTAAGCC